MAVSDKVTEMKAKADKLAEQAKELAGNVRGLNKAESEEAKSTLPAEDGEQE